MFFTKEDCLNYVKENDVRFIRLQFTDIAGNMKNIAIMDKQLASAFDNGVMFDGSAVAGFSGIESSDMFLFPDPSTFAIIPWRPQQGKVARIICDVKNHDGSQFEGDPRYILKRTLKKAQDSGYTFQVGPECEFFMFYNDDEGQPTTKTHDSASYCDLAPIDQGENTRREMCMILEEMGFEIEASHHETAAGQHEIDFKYTDALTAADNIMTFKMVVKIIAQRNGLHATFMPKPLPNVNGSGMHINMSLTQNGINLFKGENSSTDISETAKFFAAGLLRHIKGITAIANPLVNSYKRLKPGFEAPVHIAWSHMNRSPLLRVPAPRGEGTRLELRSPDPTCNPYLTLALVLEAGLDGLHQRLPLEDPINVNIYTLTAEQEKELGLERLPSNLLFALEEMKKDPLILSTLGAHTFNKYLATKALEWESYDNSIHKWEVEKYLKSY
ncbi:type I glutamate--ammonia ligase [Desulfosporosinus sp.]|uniref:type I glutamate--ammonia ligase n=1 Tax=Desulfosporosinus sp. TaxID=157907 RepID=UPI000E8F3521|nr:type I glutamate--ammonia ligase [Desulfosporosinus sp.]MBC2722561.1 type I glutamate--ammonia ligase [Desulfosporosinus sp.]MBC2726616.1 type I glutamate--ammonia ligase [Desulfosporosinus sp.]HBV87621.1 type I glutamate--ammonia ligase [Desulfosporosinus sp.]